jgi:3-dehydroquinate synthase
MGDCAAIVGESLKEAGLRVTYLPIPDGELAKTAETAAGCWAQLGQAGFTRSDAVVGVGGGATTDLAGFVAATWLRGVPIIHVPTTLLAMVDAAVGGKTGINTSEGKNLVGSFHEPSGVFCDLDLLTSLPMPDLAAGLAEVVKVGFTSDPVILDLISNDPIGSVNPKSPVLAELIERAIAVKADVVAHDLRESSSDGLGREVLNYGHTFAHAIEQVEEYRWRHGDAVAVGIVFEAHLAQVSGLLDEDVVARHYEILRSLGLPTTYSGAGLDRLVDVMKIDKKSRGDLLRFVVLEDIGKPVILAGPTADQLKAAYLALEQDAS